MIKEENAVVQQDGASSHTSHETPNKLNSVGRAGGWNTKMVTQPAHSPDFNVNDLECFASLQNSVCKEEYRAINETAGGIRTMFAEYDSEALEKLL